jgi:photosystem II stability/assembly factor-like uncharacterized protein
MKARARVGTAVAATMALLLLSGCGSSGSSHTSDDGSMTMDMNIDASGMAGHVHNLAFDGTRLLMGTHNGLWAQTGEDEPVQLSSDNFDFMGFTMAGSTWLASGHPSAGMDAPDNLGFMTSSDMGKTWTNLSLSGEVDFHRLVALGKVALGISSTTGHLLRTEDGGKTWADLGATSLYDLAISPADASTIIGTTENGLLRSTDGGKTLSKVDDAPLLALLSVSGAKVFGADVYGTVFESADAGLTWAEIGKLASQPSAFAVSGKRIAALIGSDIYLSTDGGELFTKHLVDVSGE